MQPEIKVLKKPLTSWMLLVAAGLFERHQARGRLSRSADFSWCSLMEPTPGSLAKFSQSGSKLAVQRAGWRAQTTPRPFYDADGTVLEFTS